MERNSVNIPVIVIMFIMRPCITRMECMYMEQLINIKLMILPSQPFRIAISGRWHHPGVREIV